MTNIPIRYCVKELLEILGVEIGEASSDDLLIVNVILHYRPDWNDELDWQVVVIKYFVRKRYY